MAMNESPITQFMRELLPLIDRWQMARTATWRYPEFPAVVEEAKARVVQEELAIESAIRTWVEKRPVREVRDDKPES